MSALVEPHGLVLKVVVHQIGRVSQVPKGLSPPALDHARHMAIPIKATPGFVPGPNLVPPKEKSGSMGLQEV